MTRVAIISDIHANKIALELILEDIEKRSVDTIICLGDIVTKYFYPKEVVDLIRKNASVVVQGNCDELVANDERYKFARGQLGLERIEYLASLPKMVQDNINEVLVNYYHATPDNIQAMFNPIFKGSNEHTNYKNKMVTDYNRMFVSDDPQASFYGHTHQDYIGVVQDKKLQVVGSKTIITPQDRAIINVGSAGEHNILIPTEDKLKTLINPYLTYAIVDDKGLEKGFNVEIIKVAYTEGLKKVYYDMVDKQNAKEAPDSPNDTMKVYESLVMAGEEVKEPSQIRIK